MPDSISENPKEATGSNRTVNDSAKRNALLEGLSTEERRLLELHESTRPAKSWESKKANKKNNKKSRRKGLIGILTRAETYAILFAMMPVLALVLGAIGLLAINHSMDLDLLQELSSEEALVEDLTETTGVGFDGIETIFWVQDNMVLIFLVIATVFFGIAALIMLFAKFIRANRNNKEVE